MNVRETKLFEFVKIGHIEQRRKYIDEPYYMHVLRVGLASRKANIPFGLEVGLCHDLFEDTTLQENVLSPFLLAIGYTEEERATIIDGVIHLSDVFTHENYPKLNRKERKHQECLRLYEIPADWQSIKYIDLMDNFVSIINHDEDFARTFLREKQALLKGMNKGDADLYKKCKQDLVDGLTKIGDEVNHDW